MKKYFVIFKPDGRLGNGLFRYIACALFCKRYNMNYIIDTDFNELYLCNYYKHDEVSIVHESEYINFLTSNIECKKHIILQGYFQFDYIFNIFRDDIIDFIKENKDSRHCVKVGEYVGVGIGGFQESVYDIFNLSAPQDKIYDTVIHLRLDDFKGRIDFIENKYMIDLFQTIDFSKTRNALIVQAVNNEQDSLLLKEYTDWFENNNISIKVESNDHLIDLAIIKSAKIVISQMSTFCWMAAYFSTSIEKCYMPNYNFFKDRQYCYFKHPINNTVLYNTESTKFSRIKAIILTLEKHPERLYKLTKFITDIASIGIEVEIYNGVDGSEIVIEDSLEVISKINKIRYKDCEYSYDRTKRLNGQTMKKGEFGCAWSHINIYNKLREDKDYDNYIIFEDDVQFACSLEKFYNTLQGLPKDFDVLHICESDCYPFHKIGRVEDTDFYVPYKRFFNRLTAYIVSKKGADKIINYTNSFINVPSDDLLSGMYINSDLVMYVPENFLFRHQYGTESITGIING